MTSSSSPADPASKHNIPYRPDFEDAVMRIVLSPPPPHGITLVDEGHPIRSPTGDTMPRSAIDPSTLPQVAVADLPLGLNHATRRFRSSVPGINVTHPGGLLEGGPGPGCDTMAAERERRELVQDVIEEHGAKTAAQFWAAVEREKKTALAELAERMEARQRAMRHNEAIDRELEQLREQRSLEVRVVERRRGMGKG